MLLPTDGWFAECTAACGSGDKLMRLTSIATGLIAHSGFRVSGPGRRVPRLFTNVCRFVTRGRGDAVRHRKITTNGRMPDGLFKGAISKPPFGLRLFPPGPAVWFLKPGRGRRRIHKKQTGAGLASGASRCRPSGAVFTRRLWRPCGDDARVRRRREHPRPSGRRSRVRARR